MSLVRPCPAPRAATAHLHLWAISPQDGCGHLLGHSHPSDFHAPFHKHFSNLLHSLSKVVTSLNTTVGRHSGPDRDTAGMRPQTPSWTAAGPRWRPGPRYAVPEGMLAFPPASPMHLPGAPSHHPLTHVARLLLQISKRLHFKKKKK